MGGRMRQHVMANEYQMLLDFESKDAALAQKLAKAQKAKEDVAHEIDSCGEKLVQKQEELAVWQEKDKLIMEEFSKLVGASNQFEPQLLKMFKRKIKRAKSALAMKTRTRTATKTGKRIATRMMTTTTMTTMRRTLAHRVAIRRSTTKCLSCVRSVWIRKRSSTNSRRP